MFIENELIKKFRINKPFTPGHYQRENPNKELFDKARRELLIQSYFGAPENSTNILLSRIKSPKEAITLATYNAINKKLNDLRNLAERPHLLSNGKVLSKANLVREKLTTIKPLSRSQLNPSFKSAVRVYSVKNNCYEYSPVHEVNKSVKITYLSMKSEKNIHSVNICGSSIRVLSNKPFNFIKDYVRKSYCANTETSKDGWKDKGKVMVSFNYESSPFNMINHSKGQSRSVERMLKDNKKVFHKVKSIAEYSDLTRLHAERLNKEYGKVIKERPACFLKPKGLCAIQQNVAKTYGPHYNLFK